jgi:hypothetical protein
VLALWFLEWFIWTPTSPTAWDFLPDTQSIGAPRTDCNPFFAEYP